MTTDIDTPRSRLTQDTPAGEPDHASRHIPIGSYTDDPAANARHSADIADMMADRPAEAPSGRPRVPRPPSTRWARRSRRR